MNPEKKLVVFGEDWGRFPSSTQYLISELLKLGWEVLWINSIGMRNPIFEWSYFRRVGNKLFQYLRAKMGKGKRSNSDKLTIIYPMIIPFIGHSLINKINSFFLKKQLEKSMLKNQFIRPIVWMTLPTAFPYYSIFSQCPLVYYCCDDYSELGNSPNPKIITLEEQLVAKANLIMVVSEVLGDKMPGNKIFFLDHGIDLEAFLNDYPRPVDLPQGKPIVGFYGFIGHWVNINLMYQCAAQLPGINFIFIGPTDINLNKLNLLENFYYLGEKPYAQIPAYSQHWDVSIIPFMKNKLTAALNPLKVKEYLASGNPVVSVDLPALRAYEDYIYLAKDDDEFIQDLQLAVNEKVSSRKPYDIKNHGWDSRAILLEKKLLEL